MSCSQLQSRVVSSCCVLSVCHYRKPLLDLEASEPRANDRSGGGMGATAHPSKHRPTAQSSLNQAGMQAYEVVEQHQKALCPGAAISPLSKMVLVHTDYVCTRRARLLASLRIIDKALQEQLRC